jgi:DNA-binding response OmpR family regulator
VSIQFGPFTLDLDTRQLVRAGRDVHLTPKAFDLLATLAVDRLSALSKQASRSGSGRTPS